MLVARLPSLERGAAVGPIEVTGSMSGAEIGCDYGGRAVPAAVARSGTAAAVRTGRPG